MQTGEPAIIENQLEPTDHSHLGQLITYASGVGAGTIVWVSPEFREEHGQALTWLNELTPEEVGFFGVEVEILEINGQRAVNFRLVAAPNSWQKTAAGRKGSDGSGVSHQMLRYQEFFSEVLGEFKGRSPNATSATKTQPHNWFQFACTGGAYFAWSFSRDSRFKVELTIDTEDGERNRDVMRQLESEATALKDAITEPLEWDLSDTRRSQRVAVFYPQPLSINSDTTSLDAAKPWAVERMARFVEHWRPLVRSILG
ncbi:MAG: DUF4268 domain-containing protein [Chloroflexi bacterium]|nr:DUF4268 domain-containing protein [Chloroflexota bacterium]MQC16814.1 DUF4268 domain-containing protein [Chloroflexota bacterium]